MYQNNMTIFNAFLLLICFFIIDIGNEYYIYNKLTETIKNFNKDLNVAFLKNVIRCNNIELVPTIKQHGNYWVLHNYVQASKSFDCDETVTLALTADYRSLSNILMLVEQWKGPISVTVYAPGDDFEITMQLIGYLRQCTKSAVKDFVSFHILFDSEHMPKEISVAIKQHSDNENYSCNQNSPQLNYNHSNTYANQKHLPFPINVARNIARESSQTHFIFSSDIELYPSANFISDFFGMVLRNPNYFANHQKNVFVLPIFEMKADADRVPQNKTELQTMIKDNTVFLFHDKVCAECHKIPYYKEWIEADESPYLDVFHSAKKHTYLHYWEPLFIATGREPFFDERLTSQDPSNKMSLVYALCLLDYNFLILNNAFVVHKEVLNTIDDNEVKDSQITKHSYVMLKGIQNELTALLGSNKNC